MKTFHTCLLLFAFGFALSRVLNAAPAASGNAAMAATPSSGGHTSTASHGSAAPGGGTHAANPSANSALASTPSSGGATSSGTHGSSGNAALASTPSRGGGSALAPNASMSTSFTPAVTTQKTPLYTYTSTNSLAHPGQPGQPGNYAAPPAHYGAGNLLASPPPVSGQY